MTDKVVELLYRSIIQHLAGDIEKSKEYTEKAIEIDERTCVCGGQTVPCRYNKRHSRLCTKCGLIWRKNEVVESCYVNSRRVG